MPTHRRPRLGLRAILAAIAAALLALTPLAGSPQTAAAASPLDHTVEPVSTPEPTPLRYDDTT